MGSACGGGPRVWCFTRLAGGTAHRRPALDDVHHLGVGQCFRLPARQIVLWVFNGQLGLVFAQSGCLGLAGALERDCLDNQLHGHASHDGIRGHLCAAVFGEQPAPLLGVGPAGHRAAGLHRFGRTAFVLLAVVVAGPGSCGGAFDLDRRLLLAVGHVCPHALFVELCLCHLHVFWRWSQCHGHRSGEGLAALFGFVDDDLGGPAVGHVDRHAGDRAFGELPALQERSCHQSPTRIGCSENPAGRGLCGSPSPAGKDFVDRRTSTTGPRHARWAGVAAGVGQCAVEVGSHGGIQSG